MILYKKLVEYKTNYYVTFGYLNLFVGRVTRPLRVLTPWDAELGSCTTRGRRRAAAPPPFVTFDCGFFEALLLVCLGHLDTF